MVVTVYFTPSIFTVEATETVLLVVFGTTVTEAVPFAFVVAVVPFVALTGVVFFTGIDSDGVVVVVSSGVVVSDGVVVLGVVTVWLGVEGEGAVDKLPAANTVVVEPRSMVAASTPASIFLIILFIGLSSFP
jgi:hypothetical protein